MKFFKKLLPLTLALAIAFSAVGCSKDNSQPDSSSSTVEITDRAGNQVVLKEEINTIISLAPAITEVIADLGLSEKLIAVDTQSPIYVKGIENLPAFDLMAPDIEQLASLNPDVIFASGLSYVAGENPFAQLIEMGIAVIEIPSSESLKAIQEDIIFISKCLNSQAKGKQLVDDMQKEIDNIANIAKDIADKKTVMFEISELPYIYSFGTGTFLDEMITVIGAENVFADQKGWLPVSEETALAKNPDVIMTSVNYLPDAVGEILSRRGWEVVNAVKNNDVYYIDNGASSLQNHNVIIALKEMAKAVYPEFYSEI